jgi:hypothetical protein
MDNYNMERIDRLIRNAISGVKLNLNGLKVLTEAATGFYALTPIIAALAGADNVYAMAKSTRFGKAKSVARELLFLAEKFGVDSRLKILFERDDPRVGLADVVTNLGMLRPLDSAFLSRLKPTAVIPLMWETWEFRSSDLDLPECHRLGIPVLGTDEHQSSISIFNYVGHLSLKLLLVSGIELYRSKVAVLGSGEFAEMVVASLTSSGAEVMLYDSSNSGWVSNFRGMEGVLDALCIIDHSNFRVLIGATGPLMPEELSRRHPGITIAHISGNVDRAELVSFGVRCIPEQFAPPGVMSVTTDFLGPRPLIDLHTAGLRVGEVLARARLAGHARIESEKIALETEPLAQAFV